MERGRGILKKSIDAVVKIKVMAYFMKIQKGVNSPDQTESLAWLSLLLRAVQTYRFHSNIHLGFFLSLLFSWNLLQTFTGGMTDLCNESSTNNSQQLFALIRKQTKSPSVQGNTVPMHTSE